MRKILMLTFTVLVLVGCGGGGDSSSTNTPTPQGDVYGCDYNGTWYDDCAQSPIVNDQNYNYAYAYKCDYDTTLFEQCSNIPTNTPIKDNDTKIYYQKNCTDYYKGSHTSYDIQVPICPVISPYEIRDGKPKSLDRSVIFLQASCEYAGYGEPPQYTFCYDHVLSEKFYYYKCEKHPTAGYSFCYYEVSI